MGNGFLHGNGGANPLNFKVVGGTTAPANPSENANWINTDQTITSWIISADEPSAPAEGMIWISSGTNSTTEFNALKKNGIQVCPGTAKQYTSGAWVKKTAQTYQGGEWVVWALNLYNYGDTCNDVTGGYAAAGKAYASWATGATTPTVSYGSDAMTIKATNNTYGGIVYTKKKIDLRGYDTLYFTGKLYTGEIANNWRTTLRIWSSFGTYAEDNTVAAFYANNKDGTWSIDVSELNSADGYYIGFFVYTNETCVTMKKMWLE